MASEQYLRISEEASEFIRKAHPQLKRKIRDALKNISENPNAGKPLRDELDGLRSFRISRFRIIYRILPHRQIDIAAIGHRENIYDNMLEITKKI
jgi:mRNA interferase RelE/StbE